MSVKSLRIPFLACATGAAIVLGACSGAPESAPAPAPASAPPAEPVACDDTGGLSLPPMAPALAALNDGVRGRFDPRGILAGAG